MKLKTAELCIYQDLSTHSTSGYNRRTVTDTFTQLLRNLLDTYRST